WAGLDGFAAVDIGIAGVASAGIGIQLTLIELHLPFTATAALHQSAVGQVALTGGYGLGLKMRSLDGSVNAHAEGVVISVQTTLFSWSGVELDTRLFDSSYSVPIPLK